MTAMEPPKTDRKTDHMGTAALGCPAGQSPASSPRDQKDLSSTSPIVSIIIPARNEESNLGTCLESLTAQIGVPFEIIVVNDDSTDRTQEIASSFKNVRVI